MNLMTFKRRLLLAIATCGYIGKLPFAPGTFGSLAGLPLFLLMSSMKTAHAAVFLAVFTAAAVLISGLSEQLMVQKDPKSVVIDEIAGMGVTFIGLPFSWQTAITGFILFRIFDIFKPYPIRAMEKRFSGGFGVVIDDLAAGLISRIILGAVTYLL